MNGNDAWVRQVAACARLALELGELLYGGDAFGRDDLTATRRPRETCSASYTWPHAAMADQLDQPEVADDLAGRSIVLAALEERQALRPALPSSCVPLTQTLTALQM